MDTNNATYILSEDDGSTQKKQKIEQPSDNNIIIKFTNNKNDQPFYCTVKKTVVFRKIFQTYLQHFDSEGHNIEFLYEGNRVLPNLTPEDINFPDGGEIDAMVRGFGGGCNGPTPTS